MVVRVENVQRVNKMLEEDIDHRMVVDNNLSYYTMVVAMMEEEEVEDYDTDEFVVFEDNDEENYFSFLQLVFFLLVLF